MGKKPMINSGGEKLHVPFSAGDSVEVRSDDEGFCGAWYEAKVIKPFHKRRCCLVEYSSLLCEQDQTKLLKETVSLSNIRPPPPRRASNAPPYEVFQRVEAFHAEGWWPAVITQVKLAGGGKLKSTAAVKYVATFPTTRETEEFSPEEVRPFFIWKDGCWVERDDQEGEAERHFPVGRLVEVSRDKESYGASWFIAMVKKIINGSTILVEYDKLMGENQYPLQEILDVQYVRPIPPKLDETNYKVLDKVEAFYADRWISASIEKVLSDTKYLIRSKCLLDDAIEFDGSKLRYCQDWDDDHWVKHRRSRYPIKSSQRRRQQTTSGTHTITTPGKSNGGIDEGALGRVVKTPGDKADNNATLASMKTVKRKSKQDNGQLLSLITGRSVDSVTPLEIRPAPDGGSFNDCFTPSNKIAFPLRQTEDVGRGESEKPLLSNNTSPRKRKADEDGKAGRIMAGNESASTIRIEDSITSDYYQSTAPWKGPLPNSISNRAEELLDAAEFSEPGYEGESNAVVEDALPNIPSSTVTNIEQACTLFKPCCESPRKRFNLPFSKNSVLWQSVESMDCFRVMPQEPHFRPLKKHPQNLREGMAIGLMVTFTNVVADISKLKIEDSDTRFGEIFHSLAVLEENGFYTHKIRCRLEKLIELRRRLQLSNENETALKEKIVELRYAKIRFDAQMASLDKGIIDRERELKSLHEEKAISTIEGKNIDSEVDAVVTDFEVNQQTSSLCRSSFVALSNAEWEI